LFIKKKEKQLLLRGTKVSLRYQLLDVVKGFLGCVTLSKLLPFVCAFFAEKQGLKHKDRDGTKPFLEEGLCVPSLR